MNYEIFHYCILENEKQKKLFDEFIKLFPFSQKVLSKKQFLKLLIKANNEFISSKLKFPYNQKPYSLTK